MTGGGALPVPRRRAAGDLESEILAALWAAEAPVTVAEVVDVLGGELAHNTVLTILTRLHAKGAVAREPAGRGHRYSPVLDEAGITAQRMRALLDKEADHSAVLRRVVGTLTPAEEATLAELLTHTDPL